MASAWYGTFCCQPAVTVTRVHAVPGVTECLQAHSLPFSAPSALGTGTSEHLQNINKSCAKSQ